MCKYLVYFMELHSKFNKYCQIPNNFASDAARLTWHHSLSHKQHNKQATKSQRLKIK